MSARAIVILLSTLTMLAILALVAGSPLLFEAGICILGIIIAGIGIFAGSVTAERLFPFDREERL